MPFKLKHYILILFALLFANSFCQERYNSPLAIDLKISGGFGDARNGTFHFGIDFTTEKKNRNTSIGHR